MKGREGEGERERDEKKGAALPFLTIMQICRQVLSNNTSVKEIVIRHARLGKRRWKKDAALTSYNKFM